MITDSIADGLTTIRNAARANKKSVTLPVSKVMEALLKILLERGYIESFKVFQDKEKKFVRVHLKYKNGKEPAFQVLRRISKPGLRRYVGVDSIPRVLNGLGISILSTSKGIMSNRDARKQRVGGELLCEVW